MRSIPTWLFTSLAPARRRWAAAFVLAAAVLVRPGRLRFGEFALIQVGEPAAGPRQPAAAGGAVAGGRLMVAPTAGWRAGGHGGTLRVPSHR